MHSAIGRASVAAALLIACSAVAAGSVNAAMRDDMPAGSSITLEAAVVTILRKAAGTGHADHRAVGAQIVAALDAEFAMAARDQRIDGDTPATAGARQDFAGQLVAENQRRNAPGIAAVISVHVGPADAYGVDANEDLVDRRRRLRLVAKNHFVGARVDQRFHRITRPKSRHRQRSSAR